MGKIVYNPGSYQLTKSYFPEFWMNSFFIKINF